MLVRGTGVALITPFLEDKSIDYLSLGKVIDHCISGGVSYLVSLGTTGESVTLTSKEKQEVLRFTAKHTDKRVPLVAGFGGNNTADVVNNIKTFDLSGYKMFLAGLVKI